MPLTKKGSQILSSMKDQYGGDRGERVFYASINKGTVSGAEKRSTGGDVPMTIAYDIKRRNKADGGTVQKSRRAPVEKNPDLAFDPFERAAYRQSSSVLRRAAGGEVPPDPGPLHEGPVVSDVPGRTDKHNIRVRAGSYVLPSSHVASLAEDNTLGGFSVLDKMFKKPAGAKTVPVIRGPRGPNRKRRAFGGGLAGLFGGMPGGSPMAQPAVSPAVSPSSPAQSPWMQSPQWGQMQQAFAPIGRALSPYAQQLGQAFAPIGQAFQQAGARQGGFGGLGGLMGRLPRADGGMVPDEQDVPIIVAGGEYILTPEQVMEVGNGDLKRGHEVLDAWVKRQRKSQISTLRKLPGPAKA